MTSRFFVIVAVLVGASGCTAFAPASSESRITLDLIGADFGGTHLDLGGRFSYVGLTGSGFGSGFDQAILGHSAGDIVSAPATIVRVRNEFGPIEPTFDVAADELPDGVEVEPGVVFEAPGSLFPYVIEAVGPPASGSSAATVTVRAQVSDGDRAPVDELGGTVAVRMLANGDYNLTLSPTAGRRVDIQFATLLPPGTYRGLGADAGGAYYAGSGIRGQATTLVGTVTVRVVHVEPNADAFPTDGDYLAGRSPYWPASPMSRSA